VGLVFEAGQSFGIKPFGVEAQRVLRSRRDTLSSARIPTASRTLRKPA